MSWFNKFKKKSTNNDRERGWGIGVGQQICANVDKSPKGLVNRNTNFVYACGEKISQYISSVPIHLYYETTANKTPLVTKHVKVPEHLKKQHKLDTRIYTKTNSEIVEITEHPILDLINHPAKDISWSDWVGLCATYLKICGNFLCEIVLDGDKIVALEPLKWECVEPLVDNITGKITQYRYSPQERTPCIYCPESVIHIMTREPGNLITGKGALEGCINSAVLWDYYDSYQIVLAQNNGTPGAHIKVLGKISKEQADDIISEFKRKFSGMQQGNPMVTVGPEVEITNLSIPPKDMEYKEGRNWAKKTICATMGVPEDLVDVQDSNRASSQVAIQSFIQITIYPLLSKILESINTSLVKEYYDTDAYLSYDNQEIMDKNPKEQSVIINSYVNSGIMTVNEARDILDLEPVEPVNTPMQPPIITPTKIEEEV